MAHRTMEFSLAITLAFAILAHQASAQSGCTTAIVSLAPCLGYITGNSSAPSASCCTQLASVVQSQAQCLCTLLSGSGASSFGININQTQALTLPGACKVKTPPVSQCKAGAAGPANSPPVSPATPSTPSTPSTPTTPSTSSPTAPSAPSVPAGTGSKTTPSATGGDAGGSYRSTSSTLFSALFIAVSVSSIAIF